MQLNSSRHSRSKIQETPLNTNTKREQFEATRMWTELLYEFSKKVPQENHKRQMRTYAETFTGKEALECMVALVPTIFNNGRPYNRQTLPPLQYNPLIVAKNVLNNYLDSSYIVNVRDDLNRVFYDNATLYRLDNDRISRYLEDHGPPNKYKGQSNNQVVRTSSVRESRSRVDEEPNFGGSKSRMDLNLNSSQFDKLQLRGRLSISCQDISITETNSKSRKIIKEDETKRIVEKKPSTSSADRRNLSGFIMGTITKASTSLFSLNRIASQEEPKRQRIRSTNSNPKFLDENVLRDEHSDIHISSASSSLDLPIHNQLPKHSASVFRIRSNFLQQQEATTSTREGRGENRLLKGDPRMLRIRTPYEGGKENSPSPNDPSMSTTTYCQRINRSTYEQQSKSLDKHMTALLEQILTNPNLSEAAKFEKLKQFRVSHPAIYAKRFPSRQSDPLTQKLEKNESTSSNNNTTDYISNVVIKQFKKIGF